MARPGKRSASAVGGRAGLSLPAFRRGYLAPRVSLPPHAMSARKAWVAATHAREAMQARIVGAFGRDIAGAGPGPTDFELQLFARLAIAERRLKRGLSRAKVLWPCACVPATLNRAALPGREGRQ
jgi:hypothetical protein